VEQQNIATWSVEWERHRAISLANGQAESERIQQEAQTYAHSILLSSIADGLKQTRALHPNLPRYVIAMRFVGALEKILEDQPLEDPKAKDSLQNIKYHFLTDPKKKE
jgi:regulator of protease activity HflC (stomatin/prohibitin superfamily)